MKTYNQFITELNKFEAAMKAGKLSAKALKRVFADPKTGAFKINTTKLNDWIDFKPRIRVEDGVKKFISWYKKYASSKPELFRKTFSEIS